MVSRGRGGKIGVGGSPARIAPKIRWPYIWSMTEPTEKSSAQPATMPAIKPAAAQAQEPTRKSKSESEPAAKSESKPGEEGGPAGPEPTRYGDWERNGRCVDF
jgi:hypothetical protein